MSHFTKITAQIKDLEALTAAAKKIIYDSLMKTRKEKFRK